MKKLSVLLFFFLFLLACSESNDTAGGITEDQGIVAIQNKEVAGVSQKGPFVKGSVIHLYEMNSTFAQTGKSFVGKISSDKGEFELKNINLVSSYALLEANGYYRNEVSGKVSSSTLTLNAITDLRNREHVNINLLTHLAYERIVDLISDGETLLNAKEQAEKEIFAAFGVKENFGNFEDLNVFKSGEGNAVLLAASVLVQGKLSEGDMVLLMANLSEDIAEDGSWDNDSVKTKIADVAFNMNLQKVRSNMESWNLGDSIPNFEKYVKRFWWNNYGLGECDAKREKDSSANTNSLSTNYKKNYVCSSGDWIEDSLLPVEKDSVVQQAKKMETWIGAKKTHCVNTGVEDDGSSSVGCWWYADDAENGGFSKFTWPVEADERDLSPVIDACENGICGSVKLVAGESWKFPFAQFGFDLAGSKKTGVDISSWGGLCIAYSGSGIKPRLDLVANDEAHYVEYNTFFSVLPISADTVLNVPWSNFKQESGWGVMVKRSEYLQRVASIRLYFNGGDEGAFVIKKIGVLGECE